MIKIGSHVSLNAPYYFYGSVKEALSYNANALMIYTGAPQTTYRIDTNRFLINEGRQLLKDNNIPLDNVIVHAPYIINLSTEDLEKREFAIAFLSLEVFRTFDIGANKIVVHPGAHMKNGAEIGIRNTAYVINQVIENTMSTDVKILIETMSGKGTEIGITFEEVNAIISQVRNKDRIGVCLDTCHIHDAGYDVSNFDDILDEFDKVIGLKYLKCIHLNDSKNIRGAKKDRHANIGYGYIGFDNIIKIAHNERVKDIVKILETPYVNDKAPYYEEIKMIKNMKFEEGIFDVK